MTFVRSSIPCAPLTPQPLRAFAPIQGGAVWPIAGTFLQRVYDAGTPAGHLDAGLKPAGADLDGLPYGMAYAPFPVPGTPYTFLLFTDRSLALLRTVGTGGTNPMGKTVDLHQVHPVALSFARDLRDDLAAPTTAEMLDAAIANGRAGHDAEALWAHHAHTRRHWSETPLPWIPREIHWMDEQALHTWIALHAQSLGIATPFTLHLAVPVGPGLWVPPSLDFDSTQRPSEAEQDALDALNLVLAHLPPLPLHRMAGVQGWQKQDQTQPALAGGWGGYIEPAGHAPEASAHALLSLRATWPERLAQARALHQEGRCEEPDMPRFPDEDA